jgi:hypothetical protein
MTIENAEHDTSSPPRPGATTTAAPAVGAAKETLEDYTLRFAPRSYRRWGTGTVAISALGGIAYLADFAIGANIGISYGTVNALWGIGVFAVVIFLTGFPLAYYAARYNLDLDLITRGSGSWRSTSSRTWQAGPPWPTSRCTSSWRSTATSCRRGWP